MEIDNIKNRHIRVFVSSTFRDMQEEREYLREKVYPELRVEFARRYVDLTFIDLTWGVTEEQSKSGQTMEICLQQIEKSRPFFIGILGSRYGTFPKKDFLEMNPHLKDWTWLPKDIEDELSNTEIEIQYGALRPEEETHAFFYFCKEDRPTGESKEADARQKCLKETIIEDKRYPISYYSTPEEFGLQVKNNLRGLFNRLFPPLQLPEMELEDELQDFFLKSHTRAYVPAGDYLNDIDAFIKDSEKQGLLITGAPGMGKSALIANWLSRHEDGRDKNIIYHFVGAGSLQGRHAKIAERLAWQIRRKYGLPDKNAEKENPVKMLSECLWVASERKKPLVIVIDGINQIKDEDNAKLLTWLIYSNKNVKYILTTLKEDRTMERPLREGYVPLEIKPLNETHDKDLREEMAASYLDYYGQRLSDPQKKMLCSDEKCRNPLILKSLLDELRVIGIHERLTDQIESYLATTDINGFFQTIVAHYEAVFGLKPVKTVMGLIAFSRDGMREKELREISGIEGSDWYQLFGTIYNHLIYRNGLWAFNNSYILEAVRSRYGTPKTFRRKIVKYMEDVPGDNNPEERKERKIRAYEELPYQYWLMKDYEKLHHYILQLDVFEYIYDKHANDLAEYWHKLLKNGRGKYSLSDYLRRKAKSEIDTAHYFSIIGSFASEYFAALNTALKCQYKAAKINMKVFGKEHPNTAVSYNYIGVVYESMGKFNKALQYYNKALVIREKTLASKHPDKAASYNNIGGVYESMGNYSKALTYYDKSLVIWKDELYFDHPNLATLYNNIGVVYESMGEFGRAIKYYKLALDIREKVLGKDHLSTASSYINIGGICKSKGNYDKAIVFYKRAIEIQKKVLGELHTDTAGSYNNLGAVYESKGDYDNAKKHYNVAIDILKKIHGDNHPDTAASYNNIGLLYDNLGNYTESQEYHKKTLEIYERIFDTNHPSTAASYNNIGSLYDSMGSFDKALDFYKKALSIRKKVLGKDHPDIAALYNNIGGAYCGMGNYLKALEYYKMAVEILEKVLGKGHPETAASYNNMGFVFDRNGDCKTAFKFYKKALFIWEKTLGKENPVTAVSYHNIGLTYYNINNCKNAQVYLKKALIIREKVLGKRHPDTAASYNGIGLVYDKKGNSEKALEYYKKALDIRKRVLGKGHPSTAASYNNIGGVYESEREYGKALKYCKKALNIIETRYGCNHPSTVALYNNIGSVYYNLEKYEQALYFYKKVLDIKEEMHDNNHLDIAALYNNIGSVYYCMEDDNKSLEFFIKASVIQESVLGINHPDTISTYFNIGVVYESIGNENKANEYYRKAGKH